MFEFCFLLVYKSKRFEWSNIKKIQVVPKYPYTLLCDFLMVTRGIFKTSNLST